MLLLTKVLTLLFTPTGITIALCLLALGLLHFARWRAGKSVLLLAIVWLWMSSTSFFSDLIYKSLEEDFPPVATSSLPNSDVIVVLGGGMEALSYPRTYPEVNQAGDRIIYGARLYKAGKGKKILISGGSVFPRDGLEPESVSTKTLLVDWGVAPEDIIVEDKSRTTHENAIETKKLVERQGLKSIILVTSAAHMPRSICSYEKAGMKVIPAPTDYEVTGSPSPFVLGILPKPDSQELTARGMKEYLGRWVYRLKGAC